MRNQSDADAGRPFEWEQGTKICSIALHSFSHVVRNLKLQTPRKRLHILPRHDRSYSPLPSRLQWITAPNASTPRQQPQPCQRSNLRVDVDRSPQIVRQNRMQHRQQSIQRKRRRRKKMSRNLPLLAHSPTARSRSPTPLLLPLALCRLHEIQRVHPRRVERSKIGRYEQPLRVIGQLVRLHLRSSSNSTILQDGVNQHGLPLKQPPLMHQQAAKIPRPKLSRRDWTNKGSP